MDPAIYNVRVVRMAEDLPGEIDLVLPGEQARGQSSPGTFVVNVEFPDMTPYHTCLGRFLDAWGKLEVCLRHTFFRLLGADHDRARALVANHSGKWLIDALTALAEVACTPEQNRQFVNLMERLSALNTKRNFIVHGYWCAEIFAYNTRDGAFEMKMKISREYPPTSRAVRQQLANPQNQKARTRHIFQTKRIDQIGQEIERFKADLVAFSHTLEVQPG